MIGIDGEHLLKQKVLKGSIYTDPRSILTPREALLEPPGVILGALFTPWSQFWSLQDSISIPQFPIPAHTVLTLTLC